MDSYAYLKSQFYAEAQCRAQHWQDALTEIRQLVLRKERPEQELQDAQRMVDIAKERLAGYSLAGRNFYPCHVAGLIMVGTQVRAPCA